MVSSFEQKLIRDIPLGNAFFDSLRQDYKGFNGWFESKAGQPAYVQYTNGKLTGFMYLKYEDGEVTDVIPKMGKKARTKIGTLKVDPHGTKLGERFIKKAFDHAVVRSTGEIYLTVFPHHKALIDLLMEFGFEIKGEKTTADGVEQVLVKLLPPSVLSGDLRKDYPLINLKGASYYLLSIKPEWHTKLFPDSILHTETYDLLADISHTNSISKTYVCFMQGVDRLKNGDILVIYRMGDGLGPAEYRSVVTSICTVEEMRTKGSFANLDEFIAFTEPYSVFNREELKGWWRRGAGLCVIKMLYDTALTKKVIRKTLIDDVGLNRDEYFGFLRLSGVQLLDILNRGGIDGRLIVR